MINKYHIFVFSMVAIFVAFAFTGSANAQNQTGGQSTLSQGSNQTGASNQSSQQQQSQSNGPLGQLGDAVKNMIGGSK